MKISTLAAAALLASATMVSAKSLRLTFGSDKCQPGPGDFHCHAVATPQPISFFLLAGQTVDDIAPLNENIAIKPDMTVPPFTMIRLR